MIFRRFLLMCLIVGFTPLLATVTFRDAIRSLGPGDTGKQVALELVSLANLMSEKLEYDARARKFFAFMNDALEDFDFASIYSSPWLAPTSKNFRSVVLTGKKRGNSYKVAIDNSPADFSTLGNTRFEYRMRQNTIEGDTTYTTALSVDAALKLLDAQALARLLESLMRVADPANITAIKASHSGHFPEIKGSAANLVAQASADFPRTMGMLSKFIELKSLAEVKTAGGKSYTDMAFRGRFRTAALQREYPQFNSFLSDLKNLFILQLYLTDLEGHNLMTFIINTQTEEFYWAFRTAGGKLLPLGKQGIPLFDKGITLTGSTNQKFYLGTNFFVNVYGLRINTGYIGSYLRYQANTERMSFFAKITRMPEGKISGSLFGVLPTWMIDLSIPSNLQDLMNKFSQTAFRANNGEGTKAELGWQKKNGQARLHADASTEFLDNRFIRIGMKIWVRKFRPNEGVQEDLRRFIGTFTRALLADIDAMQI
jgi:hypothetical protein